MAWKQHKTSGVGPKSFLWYNGPDNSLQINYFEYIKKWRVYADRTGSNGRSYRRHETFHKTLKAAKLEAKKYMEKNK